MPGPPGGRAKSEWEPFAVASLALSLPPLARTPAPCARREKSRRPARCASHRALQMPGARAACHAASWSARRKNRPEGVRERMALGLREQVHHASASLYRTPCLDRSCSLARPGHDTGLGQVTGGEKESEHIAGKKTLTQEQGLCVYQPAPFPHPSAAATAQATAPAGERARSWPRLHRARVALLVIVVASGWRGATAGKGTPAASARGQTASPSLHPAAPIQKRTRARRMEMEDRKSKIDTFLAVTGMSVTGLWLALGFKF